MPPPAPKPARAARRLGLALAISAALGGGTWLALRPDKNRPAPDQPTFNQHVGPLLHAQCAPCHQPGEAAPFSLLTFADARKRARQIAEVTAARLMPPWLPSAAPGHFTGERRLRDADIETLLTELILIGICFLDAARFSCWSCCAESR